LRLLLEDALHDTRANAELPADLEDSVAAGLQFQYPRLHCWLYPTPAEFRPVCPSARETGVDPLSNNPPLKLRKYAQHLKHGLTRRRRGVEPLLMKEQADSLVMEGMPSRSVSDRPSRSTDHVAIMSNSFALTAFIMASSPGRWSLPLAPLIPASS
jgi:hypothetical protein